ncbi:hypothetical protein [Kocuria kalidii]|uniref:hypothetical protein n=1 Tax=Kocuria kalidii TaxID=3376283 RepID=UPI0037ACC527
MDVVWPPVIAGPVLILIGLAIIKFRKELLSVIVEGQRMMHGQRVGQFFAKHAKPSAMLYPGVGAILLGVIMILAGLFIPPAMW